MDRLWTPWRYSYITGVERRRFPGVPELLEGWPGPDRRCVFCNMVAAVAWATEQGMPAEKAEEAAGVLYRGEDMFVCLNAYPYSSGHVMAVPYQHEASLAGLSAETASQLIHAAQRMERVLRAVYQPDGINLGLNLGEAAGAGVASHLHMHILPRWAGDTNFMTVVGETRILPETLEITWQRLRNRMAETP